MPKTSGTCVGLGDAQVRIWDQIVHIEHPAFSRDPMSYHNWPSLGPEV